MTAKEIIDLYISFFEKREHVKITNSPLVLQNDPTTLFTSSGMQPLVPYLLGEKHPQGKRLVNVQNCFRAQDIEEIGDNRHTTFFRMLGNWSLGDYFKKEQLPFVWEFLTKELSLPKEKLHICVFEGSKEVPKDTESLEIWKGLGVDDDHIYFYGVTKNWWSRSGLPETMPPGEPGGPDTEIFFDFGKELEIHEKSSFKNEACHPNCDCGRFLEICNSVFIQYKKNPDGSLVELPQKNVDFGGGLERLLAAVENQQDVFQTSLFSPILSGVKHALNKTYDNHAREIRIIVDHFISSVFIASSGIKPSNKEQGYILRRLIRRGLDSFYSLEGGNFMEIIETIIDQYKNTDEYLLSNFEEIKQCILDEEATYNQTRRNARKLIHKKYSDQKDHSEKKIGDELKGITEISTDDAFTLYTTHGLSPTQIKSLGFTFNQEEFAEKMKQHQEISRKSSSKKFDIQKEIN